MARQLKVRAGNSYDRTPSGDYPLSRIEYADETAPPFPYGPSDVRPAPPFPYGPSDVRPAPPFPYGPSDARPAPPFPYGPSDAVPPSSVGGIGSDVRFPLAPWTTNMPPIGFASGGGGIGGDWRFPEQQVDERLLPASGGGVAARGGGAAARGGGAAARGGGGGGGRIPSSATASVPAGPPSNPNFSLLSNTVGPTHPTQYYTAANLGGSGGGGLLGGLGQMLSGAVSAPAAAAPAAQPAGFQYPSPQDLNLAGAAQAPNVDDYDFGSQLLAAFQRPRVR